METVVEIALRDRFPGVSDFTITSEQVTWTAPGSCTDRSQIHLDD